MSSQGLTHRSGQGSLGVEVGRSRVRVVLLDASGRQVLDVSERPIARAGGPRNPLETASATRAALLAALDRIGMAGHGGPYAAATIGFSHCGVGSGPALRGWLESLSQELDEPFVLAGTTGVSYAPERCIEFVQRVFEGTGLSLDRVELAPVAAARVIGRLNNGAISLGSGIAWTARVLDDQVLEAFESADAPFDQEVLVSANGSGPVAPSGLAGVMVDEGLCRNRGVSVAALAPAAGAALGVLSGEPTNMLDGQTLFGAAPAVAAHGRWDADPSSAAAYAGPRGGAATSGRAGQASRSWPTHEPTGRTHQLRQVPQDVGLAPDADPYREDLQAASEEFPGIEAFAYDEQNVDRTMDGLDIALIAMAALAAVLVVLLVVA